MKKGEKLLRAIGGIDEDIIAECAPKGSNKRRRVITRSIMATAACAVLAAGITSVSAIYSAINNVPIETADGDTVLPTREVNGDGISETNGVGSGWTIDIGSPVDSEDMTGDEVGSSDETDAHEAVTEPAVETHDIVDREVTTVPPVTNSPETTGGGSTEANDTATEAPSTVRAPETTGDGEIPVPDQTVDAPSTTRSPETELLPEATGSGDTPVMDPTTDAPSTTRGPDTTTRAPETVIRPETTRAPETTRGGDGTISDTTTRDDVYTESPDPGLSVPVEFPETVEYNGIEYTIALPLPYYMFGRAVDEVPGRDDLRICPVNGASENYAVAVDCGSECRIYVNTNYSPATLGELIDDLGLRDYMRIGAYYYYPEDIQFVGAGTDKLWDTVFAKTDAPRYDDPIDGELLVTLEFSTKTQFAIYDLYNSLLYNGISVTKDGYVCIDIITENNIILSYKFDVGKDAAESLVDVLLDGYNNGEYERRELNDVEDGGSVDTDIVVEDTYCNIETHVIPSEPNSPDGDGRVVTSPPYDPTK